MELSEILNLVLGGGLLAAVIGLLTLKATVRKANAEAEKARAEAETVRIDNTEQATRILIDNIVEPLKKELNETREELRATKKEFGSTKREMARLRKAIGDAGNCKHSGDCPVLFRLREHPKDCEGVASFTDAWIETSERPYVCPSESCRQRHILRHTQYAGKRSCNPPHRW